MQLASVRYLTIGEVFIALVDNEGELIRKVGQGECPPCELPKARDGNKPAHCYRLWLFLCAINKEVLQSV